MFTKVRRGPIHSAPLKSSGARNGSIGSLKSSGARGGPIGPVKGGGARGGPIYAVTIKNSETKKSFIPHQYVLRDIDVKNRHLSHLCIASDIEAVRIPSHPSRRKKNRITKNPVRSPHHKKAGRTQGPGARGEGYFDLIIRR